MKQLIKVLILSIISAVSCFISLYTLYLGENTPSVIFAVFCIIFSFWTKIVLSNNKTYIQNSLRELKNSSNKTVKFLVLLGFKIEVDSIIIRREIYCFLNSNGLRDDLLTDIKTHETKKGLLVTITSHRPGLLIGTHGCIVNDMTNVLKLELNREDIEIHFKEPDVWKNLYK